jgi:hypothetical protein
MWGIELFGKGFAIAFGVLNFMIPFTGIGVHDWRFNFIFLP